MTFTECHILKERQEDTMLICTLFGDDEVNEGVRLKLRQTMTDLIENHNVDLFYVGEEGNFNQMVIEELKKLIRIYRNIFYEILVCNIPRKGYSGCEVLIKNLMLINGDEGDTREQVLKDIEDWMVSVSDCVIIYDRKSDTEIHRLKESAEKQGKTIIEI